MMTGVQPENRLTAIDACTRETTLQSIFVLKKSAQAEINEGHQRSPEMNRYQH